MATWFDEARLDDAGVLETVDLRLRTLELANAGCTGRLFPETGKCVNEPFLSYWNGHGGLAINGLSRGPQRELGSRQRFAFAR